MMLGTRHPMRGRLIRPWRVKLNITPLPCGGLAAGMMRNRCVISRKTTGQSATSAGLTTTWTQTYEVCCSWQALSAGEDGGQMRESARYRFAAYFPPDTDIKHTDRVQFVNGPAALAGRVFEVVSYPIDDAGMRGYVKVFCEEVKGNR